MQKIKSQKEQETPRKRDEKKNVKSPRKKQKEIMKSPCKKGNRNSVNAEGNKKPDLLTTEKEARLWKKTTEKKGTPADVCETRRCGAEGLGYQIIFSTPWVLFSVVLLYIEREDH